MLHVHLSLAVQSVDPALGRLDYDSLPDQACMELLVAGFDEASKKIYQDRKGNFHNVCEWRMIECDESKNVTKIGLRMRANKKAQRTVDFAFLPPHVTKVTSKATHLKGTLETSTLPQPLQDFNVYRNKMEGTLNLETLPAQMVRFNVGQNALSGSLRLTKLPETLEVLGLSQNAFQGSITFESLPAALKRIDLSSNQIKGSLSFQNLPKNIEDITLDSTKLSGSFLLDKFYAGLQELSAKQTKFSGTAVVHSRYDVGTVRLPTRTVSKIIDENGVEKEDDTLDSYSDNSGAESGYDS